MHGRELVAPVRVVAALLMVLYLGVVAFIVFVPDGGVPSGAISAIAMVLQDLGAPAWVTGGRIEFATNVMLFMPLTIFGAVLMPSWRWLTWLQVGFGFTVAIEVLQLLFLPGRSPQVGDIVANTLGAMLGYLIVVAVRMAKYALSSEGRW